MVFCSWPWVLSRASTFLRLAKWGRRKRQSWCLAPHYLWRKFWKTFSLILPLGLVVLGCASSCATTLSLALKVSVTRIQGRSECWKLAGQAACLFTFLARLSQDPWSIYLLRVGGENPSRLSGPNLMFVLSHRQLFHYGFEWELDKTWSLARRELWKLLLNQKGVLVHFLDEVFQQVLTKLRPLQVSCLPY